MEVLGGAEVLANQLGAYDLAVVVTEEAAVRFVREKSWPKPVTSERVDKPGEERQDSTSVISCGPGLPERCSMSS